MNSYTKFTQKTPKGFKNPWGCNSNAQWLTRTW